MSARRSERLLNLLIMLLVQDRPVPKEKIREVLYKDVTGDAFERKFDRDKEELRGLGVPIEVLPLDEFFDDEVGYRIPPDEYALPEITFTAEEAAVVALAGKVWGHASVADDAAAALRKLSPVLPAANSAPAVLPQFQIHADEPTFDVFWQATQERRTVTFDYRRPGQTVTSRRTLQPWGVVRHSGRWYVVGQDLSRGGQERVFRLSRVQGDARPGKEPDAFEVPEGTDLHAVAARLAPSPDEVVASVLVRQGAGHGIRRRGQVTASGVAGPDGGRTWDRLRLTGATTSILVELLPLADHVYVESPEDVRTTVIERLRGLAGTTQPGSSEESGQR